MTTTEFEQRLTAVEQELAQLKAKIASAPSPNNWVEAIAGSFANDPIFDDAMRLGRKWRDSHRPKSKARAKTIRRIASRKPGK